jgi:hypothetical protein
MTRTISTSVETLGYYCTVPRHIEDLLDSHFENLSKEQQYTLLATFAVYMARQANNYELDYSLYDAYNSVSGYIPEPVTELFEEIEKQPDGTILALSEALVLNIHYTQVEQE